MGKNSPSAPLYTIHNKGTFDDKTPGKMVESLGPASPPYWVLKTWPDAAPYDYALVYACVGSPLLGEYTYFYSRTPTIPAAQMSAMRDYASTQGISLSDRSLSAPLCKACFCWHT